MHNDKLAKLVKAFIYGIVVMIICSSCIFIDRSVATREEIMDVAERVYGDKVIFIERHKVKKNPDQVEYTFQIKGRDIKFKIIAYQYNLDWHGEPRDSIRRPEIKSTYYDEIKKYYQNEQENKLKQLGIDQVINSSGNKVDDKICINKSEDLDKAAEYICYLDSLYQFELNAEETKIFCGGGEGIESLWVNLKEVREEEGHYNFIAEVYFSDGKERLKYDEVYQLLKEAYEEEIEKEKVLEE